MRKAVFLASSSSRFGRSAVTATKPIRSSRNRRASILLTAVVSRVEEQLERGLGISALAGSAWRPRSEREHKPVMIEHVYNAGARTA